jgi:LuxR family maltose regulon positive regulatory protein
LPTTLVTRSALHDKLTAGASQRLTAVVGSAGAGKSVLLSSWAAARPAGRTAWMSCDRADADPVRFWAGFIEAPQGLAPGFGAEAADLLAIDGAVSADLTASIANDAAELPVGSAIIVDDFHAAAPMVGRDMTDLVERWPSEVAQLVVGSRSDPPLRLHRLRMSGELCELRDRDLYFSVAESRDLLANFDVAVAEGDLALLHERSEGWPAVLQMAALSLRSTTDPQRVARALDVRSHLIDEYFSAEVLEQQTPEVARFMLDTSILGSLTAAACAAVTGRPDAVALLRHIDAANLFIVALDDARTRFRYHHLVRRLLRAELRASDAAREQKLQVRAAEWFESIGDTRRATRHFLAAKQVDRALAPLQDRVVPDFLHDPVAPPALDLSAIDPALLLDAPDRLLGLAADLLLSGNADAGGHYLDVLERVQPSIPPGSQLAARFAVMRAFHYAQTGQLSRSIASADTARDIQQRTQLKDEWNVAVPLILLRVYPCLDDFPAVEREAAAALALPELPEPARAILVPSARALAWFEAGRLTEAADAAVAAEQEARRLKFDQHFFAVDYLRVLSGVALERRDLDVAERFAEQALSLTERWRPIFEFLTLLDRARIWAARGQFRQALGTVEAARRVMAGPRSELMARANELEASLRLWLGDLNAPADLARGLPPARRALLLAKIAVAADDHRTAKEHLHSSALSNPTPRQALVRELLLGAAAIVREDPMTIGVLEGALQSARREGLINTIVTTAPPVTSYLIEHSIRMRPDPFRDKLIAAALEVRAAQTDGAWSCAVTEQLTAAELRILRLLPTSTYLQIAATLYISRNTVKTQLRSIYQKLGVTSRSEAIQRAVDLRLL